MKRTLLAAGFAAVLAAVGLAGCSSGTDGDTHSSAVSSSASDAASEVSSAESSESALPVTITHRYGSTEITKAPKRVVSLGYTDQDALLALGITPVSVLYWDGMTPEGKAAGVWSLDRIHGEAPRINKDPEVNPESIAKDKPDLIVAAYSDIDEDTYKELSAIAPVVVQKGDYKELQQPWDVTTLEIGKAVGKEKEAEELVQGVKDKFEALKKKHPEWQGKTLAVATTEEDKLYVFSDEDPRSRFFSQLGFTINPALKDITGDKFYGEVSKENAQSINSDVLVWDQLSYSPKKDKTSVTEDSILSKLPAVADGHSVYLEGDSEKAFGWQTVASLDYLLDHIEQLLVDAAS